MGIRTGSFSFKMKNKVGGLIFYTGKGGQQIVREHVKQINDKKSPGQISQRERQTSILRLFQLFKPGILNAYGKKKATLNDYNEFMRLNSEVFAEAINPTDATVWNQVVLSSPGLSIQNNLDITFGESSVSGKMVAQCVFTPSNPLINSEGTIIQMNFYNPDKQAGRSVSYKTTTDGAVTFFVRLEEYGLDSVEFATRTGRNPRTGASLDLMAGSLTGGGAITVGSGAIVL